MKNLRITPKRNSVDTYATGDYQHYDTFEIRRDFEPSELVYNHGRHKGQPINYSQSVLDAGVVVETLRSEDNAKLLLSALLKLPLQPEPNDGKRKTTEQEKEVLVYLNQLRESGETNMFGATPYIINQFALDKQTAQKLLGLWMHNFNADGNYDRVTDK